MRGEHFLESCGGRKSDFQEIQEATFTSEKNIYFISPTMDVQHNNSDGFRVELTTNVRTCYGPRNSFSTKVIRMRIGGSISRDH